LPLKIDLGEVVQGAMLMAVGLVLIIVWFLARVLSFILPFGSPESLLYIGVILFMGGIGLALTGFRYRRRSR
jgi:hypothetical protein